jgi:leucyl-tRNA synthetase
MFAAPPEQQLEWSGAGVDGATRFLRRVWMYSSSQADGLRAAADKLPADLSDAEKELRREVHSILKQANFDYQRRQYNTVVSAAMKMLNVLEPMKLDQAPTISAPVLRESLSILLRVLYPVVPHLTHVLWKDIGYDKSFGPLLDAPWPAVDESALVQTEITLMLQINGKLRGDIRMPADASREQIEALALQSEPAVKALNGGAPKKIIVVPGRLVNIVA